MLGAVGGYALVIALGLALLVGLTGWLAHRGLKVEMERRIAADLEAVRETAVQGVRSFLDGAERLTALVADAPEVKAAAAGARPGAGTTPTPMARALVPYLRVGNLTGYVLADAAGTVLEAGGGLALAGQVLAPEILPVVQAGRSGSPRTGMPFRAPGGQISVLVAVPVSGSGLFLGLGVRHGDLAGPLLAARGGFTGETYAFDGRGRMISSSRFAPHLRGAGLINPDDEDSTLRVEIRDPGGDTTRGYRAATLRRDQPLTRAAAAGVAGGSAVDVVPYRDYRGVPVVGAWRWLSDRGFAVVTEVDAAEAFQPLQAIERIFGGMLALVTLAGAVAAAGLAVAQRARRRAARAELQARRLGEYTIERKVGSGANGDVYLARHALLRRPTALKLLRTDSRDRGAFERFQREVQLTASLSHPNTIAIYDYGRSQDGLLYYAMEYLEGIDFERLVARFGPCSEGRVAHLLRQVCSALGEAHARGLVHRDIKPANLFLCRRGGIPDFVKVLDFGLARAAGPQRVTRASVIVGTPENMAPELFESAEKASPRSDIYALGCVGYYLVTGQPIFEGSSLSELCNAHLSKTPVPPSQRLGTPIDAALERLLMSTLAKDPAQRPQSVAEIVALLDRSPVSTRWTAADATAFWAAHGDRLGDEPEEGPRESAVAGS